MMKQPTMVPEAAAVTGPDGVVLLPVSRVTDRCTRPVGAYIMSARGVCFRPVVDAQRLAMYGAVSVVAVATVVAVVGARRREPAIGSVSMGPGGWVSLKGVSAPALKPCGSPRPWWARLLGARRLTVQ